MDRRRLSVTSALRTGAGGLGGDTGDGVCARATAGEAMHRTIIARSFLMIVTGLLVIGRREAVAPRAVTLEFKLKPDIQSCWMRELIIRAQCIWGKGRQK
jgi:hypothetical protein